ncbi:uncharacterized protein LOC144158576 isoform X6 [Haemaphysalis longicornis]
MPRISTSLRCRVAFYGTNRGHRGAKDTTATTSTGRQPFSEVVAKRRSEQEYGRGQVLHRDTAALTSSMAHATSSMSGGYMMTIRTYAAHNRSVSCRSQKTQAAITTNAIGTQCGLMLFKSASSQTAAEFPGTLEQEWEGFPAAFLETVLDEDNAQVCAPMKFASSQDGGYIAVDAGLHIGSCDLHSGNTRRYCNTHIKHGTCNIINV